MDEHFEEWFRDWRKDNEPSLCYHELMKLKDHMWLAWEAAQEHARDAHDVESWHD